MKKRKLTYLRPFLILSLLLIGFMQTYAQNEDTAHPFYKYFLWYTGTIGNAPVNAKVAITDGTYSIDYAYDTEKKWIHLINPKITNTTFNAEVEIDGKGSKNFVELQMDDLHNITGVLKPITGEQKIINLKVTLKELPKAITNSKVKNEFTPLLLDVNKVTDSIGVYYSEEDQSKELVREVYSKLYPDEYNPIIYVDVNFDGYLDLVISDAIFFFRSDKQHFEIESTLQRIYPGIEYMGSYNPYAKTFQSSHWRTIIWYKTIDNKIITYETEEYWDYSEEQGHNNSNVSTSENRVRYNEDKESYSKLELYLNKENTLTPKEIVIKFIGDRKIGIIDNARLIIYYDNSKKTCHHYVNSNWELLYTEINGIRIDP